MIVPQNAGSGSQQVARLFSRGEEVRLAKASDRLHLIQHLALPARAGSSSRNT
jgi:hypothetical protein